MVVHSNLSGAINSALETTVGFYPLSASTIEEQTRLALSSQHQCVERLADYLFSEPLSAYRDCRDILHEYRDGILLFHELTLAEQLVTRALPQFTEAHNLSVRRTQPDYHSGVVSLLIEKFPARLRELLRDDAGASAELMDADLSSNGFQKFIGIVRAAVTVPFAWLVTGTIMERFGFGPAWCSSVPNGLGMMAVLNLGWRAGTAFCAGEEKAAFIERLRKDTPHSGIAQTTNREN